jgi:U3 small nucleolar RNA-associated protein 23
MTTYCCYAELKKLGPDFRPTAAWAKKLEKLRKCSHSPAISAAECIKEIIGTTNENRFCVATNDKKLRIHLRTVPAVPLVYINKSVVILEPPSLTTRAAVTKLEIQKTAPLAFEVSAKAKPEAVVEIKKRKRKEPNPLSVKKAKKEAANATGEKKDEAQPEEVKKRRRKRNKSSVVAGVTDN